jgi:hypothetical protein
MQNNVKFILISSLLLAGCVRSLQPLYTEQDLIFDQNLIGCWSEGSDETWCFSKQGEKAYQLVYTDIGGKSGVFEVHLFKVDGQLFMDLLPSAQELKENDFYKFHLLPVHTFAHVKQIEPSLQMRLPEPDWLRKLVKADPSAIRHEMIDKVPLVTATTKEMQTFWRRHLDTEGAFGDFSNMQRKAESAPKDQSPEPETDGSK